MYFAYIHCKPDGSPFYVGKGNDRRVSSIKRKNKFHRDVLSKYGAENIIVVKLECASEDQSFTVERNLIADFRSLGLRLANQTNGGEGASGWVAPQEYRERKREASLGDKNPFYGKKHSPERLIADSERAKKQWENPDMRALHISKGKLLVGEKNPFFGKKHTDEYKAMASAARLGKPGRPHSEEHKAAVSKRITGAGHHFFGKKLSPEHIAKMKQGMTEAARGSRFMFDEQRKRRRVMRGDIDQRIASGWVFVGKHQPKHKEAT